MLTLAACTAEEPDEPTPPSPTATESAPSPSPEPEPSPSPSPDDPFAVPDEIDADYVERVLNEINRLDAELTRDILRRPVDPDALELPDADREVLESLYAEPLLGFSTQGRLILLRSQEERDDLVPASTFGQQLVRVEEVLATAPCVVARVMRDFTQVDLESSSGTSDIAFMFLTASSGANTTGWKLASLLESDASEGSAEEDELRTLTIADVAPQAPEQCR